MKVQAKSQYTTNVTKIQRLTHSKSRMNFKLGAGSSSF